MMHITPAHLSFMLKGVFDEEEAKELLDDIFKDGLCSRSSENEYAVDMKVLKAYSCGRRRGMEMAVEELEKGFNDE